MILPLFLVWTRIMRVGTWRALLSRAWGPAFPNLYLYIWYIFMKCLPVNKIYQSNVHCVCVYNASFYQSSWNSLWYIHVKCRSFHSFWFVHPSTILRRGLFLFLLTPLKYEGWRQWEGYVIGIITGLARSSAFYWWFCDIMLGIEVSVVCSFYRNHSNFQAIILDGWLCNCVPELPLTLYVLIFS